jgi:hypothetical protein
MKLSILWVADADGFGQADVVDRLVREDDPADAPLVLGVPTRLGVHTAYATRVVAAELVMAVGYIRFSSSTGMVRTPAVWRSYSAKPG